MALEAESAGGRGAEASTVTAKRAAAGCALCGSSAVDFLPRSWRVCSPPLTGVPLTCAASRLLYLLSLP